MWLLLPGRDERRVDERESERDGELKMQDSKDILNNLNLTIIAVR